MWSSVVKERDTLVAPHKCDPGVGRLGPDDKGLREEPCFSPEQQSRLSGVDGVLQLSTVTVGTPLRAVLSTLTLASLFLLIPQLFGPAVRMM